MKKSIWQIISVDKSTSKINVIQGFLSEFSGIVFA